MPGRTTQTGFVVVFGEIGADVNAPVLGLAGATGVGTTEGADRSGLPAAARAVPMPETSNAGTSPTKGLLTASSSRMPCTSPGLLKDPACAALNEMEGG